MDTLKARNQEKNLKEALRYAAIGILNTAVGYGSYAALLYFFKLHYLASSVLSNVVAITHAFLWHKYWTFRSKGPFAAEYAKFASFYVVSAFLGLLITAFFVEMAHIDAYRAGLISIFICAVISYFVNKYWSFREHDSVEPGPPPQG
ncbi:MAG: GtrA family protein [Candidatus Eremiobacteraeota bacterium]|nr:GtrA family protein [Candidatus Eremiobacteraeota bacterium]